MNELKRGIGSQFDPQLANAFIALIRREFWEHDDFDAFLAEGADELEYVRARTRMEAFIAEQKVVGDAFMMVAVFAAMTLALICGWFGSRTLAVALFFGCLVLSIGLFLFEIYSPESGFRMPWIQTEIDGTPQVLMIDSRPMTTQRFLASLNYIYLLLVMFVIAGILTAAMTLQYVKGELPCPLCLLERVAMFGCASGSC